MFLSLQIILQFLFKPINILFLLLTVFILKLDKFKEVKEEHSENIYSILITLLVLKLDKSNEVKDKQSENI